MSNATHPLTVVCDWASWHGYLAVRFIIGWQTGPDSSCPIDQQVGSRVFLPIEPTIDQALQALFMKLEQEALDTVMMRPLDTAVDGARLNELGMAHLLADGSAVN